MKKGKTTISDIALAAGVSKTTVSRYINGHMELMSEATRSRIKAVIEMSNYQPSDVARSLKMKRTNLIGVIISDISSPFSSALMIGIGNYLNEHGYIALFVHCDDSLEKEQEMVDMLLGKNVAGLIVNTTSMSNQEMIRTACDNVPIVLCDRYIKDYKFNIVTTETDESMYKLIEHLKEQGYTRPVLFSQDWTNNSSRLRRKTAFLAAVEQLYGRNVEKDIYMISRHKGITAAMQLQSLMDDLKPGDVPVIIGTNSMTTVRAYKAITSMELKIPDEIGICGPEDWDWQSEMNWPMVVDPPITTLYVPAMELGKQSAKMLLQAMKEKGPAREIMLPCSLRIRESTNRRHDKL